MGAAVALKTWLAEQNPPLANEIFLDVDPDSGLRAGTRWKDALRRANSRCEAVICLLSANWEASHECKVEYRTAENLNKQIFVARLEASTGDELTSEWQRCDLFGDGPKTQIDIGAGTPVEFSTEGLFRLRDGITGAGIGADSFVWPPPADPDRAPYRGWAPLDSTDAAVFFGRDAQILRALDAVRGMRLSGVNSLFVVLGPSGTGKSSFLRAGLLPRLRREDRRFVSMEIVRPERDALTGESGLAASICATRRAFGLEQPSLGDVKALCADRNVPAVAALLEELRTTAAEGLLERGGESGESPPAPTLILPLDQAEELFSADAGDAADTFLALLAGIIEALNDTQVGLIVAATIRTDRFEVMQTHPRLAGIGTVLFDELKPMPPTQFKEVIVGPAARSTESGRVLRIAPDLVDRLLVDAGHGADTLPMLALTLSRLYVDYGTSGDLTLSHYQALGGMQRVVQTEIDDVLSSNPAERAAQLNALRGAFIPWLATINPGNDQPMRRVARWADLPPSSQPLIEALVAKRLMVRDVRGGQAVVEVALESLLRQWDQLAGWLREERQDLKNADDLERSAAAWSVNGQSVEWLLEGSRLAEATVLATKPGFGRRLAGVHGFLDASHQREGQRRLADERRRQDELRSAQERADHAQERARHAQEEQATAEAHNASLRKRSRVLRGVLAGTAVVAVLALVASVLAYVSRGEAEDRFRQATSVRLTAEAQGMLSGSRPGGDVRAIQELLAARSLTARPDDDALYSAVTERDATAKIIPVGTTEYFMVAWSPDGELLAATNPDGAAQLFDSDTGLPVGDPLSGLDGRAGPMAFSPDGKILAAGDDDGSITLWDTTSRDQLEDPPAGHDGHVLSLAFSEDSQKLVSGGDDGAQVWDVETGRAEGALYDAQGSIDRVQFSGDGTLLVTASYEQNNAQLWDGLALEPLGAPIPAESPDEVLKVDLSADGRLLAMASLSGVVQLWDTKTRQKIGEPLEGETGLLSVSFSPDGRLLAVGGTDKSITLWDVETARWVGEPLEGHGEYVVAVAFSPDGRRIASGSTDGTVRVWDTGNMLVGHTGAVPSVAYSPDGDRIASGSADGTIRVWDAATGRPVGAPIDTKAGPVAGVAFTPDGNRLMSGSVDGTIRTWNADSGNEIGRPVEVGTEIVSLALSPSGKLLASGGDDGTIGLWDASTGRPEGTSLSTGSTVPSVALAGDDRMLAAVSDEGATLWDVEPGERIRKLNVERDREPMRIAVTPDGRLVATANIDSSVRLFDSGTGDPQGAPLTGHSDWVMAVAFSSDGSRLVSGSQDDTLRLWDVKAGKAIGDPLRGHLDMVASVAISPDGNQIASGSVDYVVRLWPATARPEDLCAKLTTNMSQKQWGEWVSPDIDYVKTCPDLPVAAG